MSSPSQQQEAIDNNSALPSQTPIIQAAHEMASQRFSPTQRGSTPLQPILSPKEIALSPRMANMASQTATQQGRTTPPQTDEHDLLGGENNGVNGLHIDENTDNEHHDQTFDEDETSHELAQFDWTKLEDEFEAAMHDADMKEEEVAKQFKALIDYFLIWSSVSLDADKERGFKRFKTRETHIQNSELQFQKKKEHLDKVVSAFKSAMELLQNT